MKFRTISSLLGGLWLFGLVAWSSSAYAGQLRIESKPRGASLFLNGIKRGKTPLLLTLQEGRIHLELRQRGYLTWATYLPMPPRTQVTLKVSLEKVNSRSLTRTGPGSNSRRGGALRNLAPGGGGQGRASGGLLIVNTKPSGVMVFLKGKLLGKTPLLASLKVGKHELEFRRSGYATLRKEIQVSAAKSTKLTLTMTAGRSKPSKRNAMTSDSEKGYGTQVVIISKPSGADVFLNGRSLGATPVLSAGLAPGNYQIVIRKKGFSSYRRSVDLRAGQQLRMKVTLVKK